MTTQKNLQSWNQAEILPQMKHLVQISNEKPYFVGVEWDSCATTIGASCGFKAFMKSALELMPNIIKQCPVNVLCKNDNFGVNWLETFLDSSVSADEKHSFYFAKNIDIYYNFVGLLELYIKKTLIQGFFPIVISGDHSTSFGSIAAIKNTYPNLSLGVIWIDAHADIQTPYTTYSGNLHGMPLAIASHQDNMMCQRNNPDSETIRY